MKNLIRLCILNPVAISALVMLTVVFGIVALKKIPIQMTPDIDKPILQVRVSWPGASPDDVEREIITSRFGPNLSLFAFIWDLKPTTWYSWDISYGHMI